MFYNKINTSMLVFLIRSFMTFDLGRRHGNCTLESGPVDFSVVLIFFFGPFRLYLIFNPIFFTGFRSFFQFHYIPGLIYLSTLLLTFFRRKFEVHLLT